LPRVKAARKLAGPTPSRTALGFWITRERMEKPMELGRRIGLWSAKRCRRMVNSDAMIIKSIKKGKKWKRREREATTKTIIIRKKRAVDSRLPVGVITLKGVNPRYMSMV